MSTLLAGNTAWWSDGLVAEAFGSEESVSIIGAEDAKRSGKTRSYAPADGDSLDHLLQSGFDRVVFLSAKLSDPEGDQSEFGELERLLRHFVGQKGVRFLYVATDRIDREREDDDAIRLRSLEELCRWYRNRGLDLVVLRTPLLSSPCCEEDYWNRALAALCEGRAWPFAENAEQPCDFVDMGDLARVVGQLFEDWPEDCTLRLHARGTSTFAQAADALRGLVPAAELSFSDAPVNPLLDSGDETAVEDLYGFSCETDVIAQLPTREAAAPAAGKPAKHAARTGLSERLHLRHPLVIAAELVVVGLLVEWLDALFGIGTQFCTIDFRLVYIVLFSATYGTGVGIVSAGVMMLSLLWAIAQQGTPPDAILSDPQNLIPLVFYLVIACSLGYVRQKADEDRAYAEKREEHLEGQVAFLGELYDEAAASRNAYRHDLLESRDGFGRIFDVVKRLSLEEPSRIFSASIGVLEDVLDTDKTAIYVINDQKSGFARLVVSSEKLKNRLPKSIRLEDYRSALDTVDGGEVWFNSSFSPELPSYLAGVKSEGKLRVLIMIYDTPFDQASSYYLNLVRILAGLMENFLIHAWNEERAREAERYVPGTALLVPEELEKELATLREMRANHVNDYRVLKVAARGGKPKKTAALLGRQMRSTDTAGLGKDGNVYVLLRQVDDATLPIVVKRFTHAGLDVETIGQDGEGAI